MAQRTPGWPRASRTLCCQESKLAYLHLKRAGSERVQERGSIRMKPAFSFAILIFVLTSTSEVAASESNYIYMCGIYDQLSVNDDGFHQGTLRLSFGEMFTVDRSTGVVSGEFFSDETFEGTVIDRAIGGGHFKLVYASPERTDDGHRRAFYLTIDESVESEWKPFIFVRHTTAYMGKCIGGIPAQ